MKRFGQPPIQGHLPGHVQTVSIIFKSLPGTPILTTCMWIIVSAAMSMLGFSFKWLFHNYTCAFQADFTDVSFEILFVHVCNNGELYYSTMYLKLRN